MVKKTLPGNLNKAELELLNNADPEAVARAMKLTTMQEMANSC